MFSPPESPLMNGAVGGDKGCAAADAIFLLAVETDIESPEGDIMKNRKPTARIVAKMMVIGFVRRTALGRAILEAGRATG